MKKISKRFVLHVGYSCNMRCRFCYYRESLEKGTVKDLTTEEIKKRLRVARKYGKDAVDFSGGEPTIRKDLPELIKYARTIGYQKVCIITNGIVPSIEERCREYIDSGLNDVLVSLHSAREGLHDHLTKVKGSFNKLNKAIENFMSLGLGIRINTVVTNLNYNDLDYYFSYIRKYNPKAVNLLVYNPAEECVSYKGDNVDFVDYSPISETLTSALDAHSSNFNRINVRFFPFCLLKGHENNIRTMWQKIYEAEEWDPVLFMKFRKNNFYLLLSFVLGLTASPFNQPFMGRKKLYTFLCEVVQAGRIKYNNIHVGDCRKCSHRKICPGLPRAYAKNFKQSKVFPYQGQTIKDPLYYCGIYTDSFA